MVPGDDELVRLVVDKDDREAFGELVDRHKSGIFALLYRLLGKCDEVEDIAQNVFLAAYRGLRAFKSQAQFGTWIYRIAYNHAVSELRRRRSRMEHEHQPSVDADGGFETPAPDTRSFSPEEKAISGQVWEAVNRLPTPSRAAIELYYRQGFRYPEIAEALSLPLGTVKTHLHRARRQLRELLLSAMNRVGREADE
jgi:RNA polymerase sigma-70 factor (ECF subfamily)